MTEIITELLDLAWAKLNEEIKRDHPKEITQFFIAKTDKDDPMFFEYGMFEDERDKIGSFSEIRRTILQEGVIAYVSAVEVLLGHRPPPGKPDRRPEAVVITASDAVISKVRLYSIKRDKKRRIIGLKPRGDECQQPAAEAGRIGSFLVPVEDDELVQRFREARPRLIWKNLKTDPPVAESIITDGALDFDKIDSEGFDPYGVLGPTYWRIVWRGSEHLYSSTVEIPADRVARGWGDKGLALVEPEAKSIMIRIETLLPEEE
jgi:hypothetical protein